MKEEIHDITEMRKWKFSWRIFGENFVFKEGEHFYKMPSFLAKNILYRNGSSYEKVCDSMRTIQKYFGPITKIPKTEVLRQDDWHYIIKQANISWEKLSLKIMKDNPKLISKFKRFIIANELMWEKEGFFLDLLGSDFITQPQTIHNLLTDGKEIYVFDFWLLEKAPTSKLFQYFSHLVRKVQLFFVKYFF